MLTDTLVNQKDRASQKKCGLFILKTHGKIEMRKICKSCGQLLDEKEFDIWFRAIGVRKENCKKCERRQRNEWYLRELYKQQERKKKKPTA